MTRRLRWAVLAVGACLAVGVSGQAKPWQPPKTTIPAVYREWVRALLDHGAISDPRGGRFCRLVVVLGDATYRPAEPVEVLGWVMPGERKAILLDGLTYPVQRVLGTADLDSVFEPMKSTVPPGRLFPADRIGAAVPALLLLLGDARRAERAHELLGRPDARRAMQSLFRHLLVQGAMRVGQALIDREDMKALLAAEDLDAAWRAAEWFGPSVTATSADNPPFVSRDLARQALEDCRRRVAHPKPRPVMDAIRALPQASRIAALIDALDDVGGTAAVINGGGVLATTDDNALGALISEGGAAVPALIDAMEHDPRLIRAVSFRKSFFPERRLLTVRDAARQALASIWRDAPLAEAWEPEDYGRLRAEWAKVSAINQAQRWLRVLHDDSAGPREWERAADALARQPWPDKRQDDGWNALSDAEQAEAAAIIRRRIEQSLSGGWPVPLASAARTALILLKLTGADALDTIEATSAALLRVAESDQARRLPLDQVSASLTALLAARLLAGDSSATADYARMAALAGDRDLGEEFLSLAVRHPEIPELQSTLGAVLGQMLSLSSPASATRLSRLARPEFLKNDAVRRAIAQALANESVIALSWKDAYGGTNYAWLDDGSSSDVPQYAVRTELGDVVAREVAWQTGAPAFDQLWPLKRRRAARRAMVEWLRNWPEATAPPKDDMAYSGKTLPPRPLSALRVSSTARADRATSP